MTESGYEETLGIMKTFGVLMKGFVICMSIFVKFHRIASLKSEHTPVNFIKKQTKVKQAR